MALAARINIRVTADSAFTSRGLSNAAMLADLNLTVLIECDTGAGRCGVQSPQEAAELARLIGKSRSASKAKKIAGRRGSITQFVALGTTGICIQAITCLYW